MKRDPAIDILRFLGLTLIILAHVDAPDTIKQIRMFDVPLMVFVSGLSYANKDIDNIGRFYWSRIKRLIIPVWTFIVIYFIPLFILQKTGLFYYGGGITRSTFFNSFLFFKGGMGYIWIFKVFIIVTFATPFLIKLNKKITKDYIYFSLVLLVIGVQQVLCQLWKSNPSMPLADFVEVYGLYLLGYIPMFMLGLRLRGCEKLTERRTLILICVTAIVALIIYISGNHSSIDLKPYKYPPQTYYIFYGCLVSVLLWVFRGSLVKLLDCKFVRYVGQNSDWIYLWHAFFVLYVCAFVKHCALQYVIIYSASLLVCLIQKAIVGKTKSEFIKKYY